MKDATVKLSLLALFTATLYLPLLQVFGWMSKVFTPAGFLWFQAILLVISAAMGLTQVRVCMVHVGNP
jgi:hypothetical protein